MQVHVYDFRWTDAQSVRFEASNGEKFGSKGLQIGDNLSLDLQGEVACAGSTRDGVWQACPDDVQGRAKCEHCRNREGSFVYTSFDGFNTDMFNAGDLAKIEGEHWVYLALFDENTQKIGVSKASRKQMRQLEQGSVATLYIAKTPNGTVARQIETLFRQSGMLDKVQSQAKKDAWQLELANEKAKSILRDKFNEHLDCLHPHPHLKDFILETPEFQVWEDVFGTKIVKEKPHDIHELKLQVGEAVSGSIVAIKGAFVLLDTGEELASICAKDLRGYWVDFAETAPGLRLNQALQGALF